MELEKFNQEFGDRELRWATEVTKKTKKALEDIQQYLSLHQNKPEGSQLACLYW
jgi:hypothetical protein